MPTSTFAALVHACPGHPLDELRVQHQLAQQAELALRREEHSLLMDLALEFHCKKRKFDADMDDEREQRKIEMSNRSTAARSPTVVTGSPDVSPAKKNIPFGPRAAGQIS